ncbi:MAG: hypothetical protein PHS30_06925 [Bacteroidales bacterium]|nr:hypothetical protein [Bacteroidales bacterium]
MANHITQWKPQVTVNGKTTSFSSYKEVKKNMKLLLDRSIIENNLQGNGEVMVSRSRRGEWGEWFEYWCISLKTGKPVIFKQGWM